VEHVAEILRRWDPIGAGPSGARFADEYDGYAPMLVELASQGATVDELARHLGVLRAAMTGARGDAAGERGIASAILAALDAPEPGPSAPKRHERALGGERDEGAYTCPTCSEQIVVPLDRTEGESQRYVEDCPVCCNPVVIHVEFFEDDEPPRVSAESE
jgi:hypothetical protein